MPKLLQQLRKWCNRQTANEKRNLEWSAYCSICKSLCPCFATHQEQGFAIPFRIRPKWDEPRYKGYELREMYGEDFPLFRDELPHKSWKAKQKPVPLSKRIVRATYHHTFFKRYIGSDGILNAYGTVVVEEYNPNFPSITLRTLPIICGHGGSQWFCGSCAISTLEFYETTNHNICT